jgi:hypothetical protein
MTKHIQLKGWDSLSPSKQEEIKDWITQILNAKLASHNLVTFLTQSNLISDDSISKLIEVLKREVIPDFNITEQSLPISSQKNNLMPLKAGLKPKINSPINGVIFEQDILAEIVCTLVCGRNNNDCHKECTSIFS